MATLAEYVQTCCDGRGLSAVRMRRLFTLLVQELFSKADQLGEYGDELVCLHYDVETPASNNLYIGPTFTGTTEQQDPKNAVYISVHRVMLDKVGLGSRVGVSPDGATKVYVKKCTAQVRCRVRHQDVDVALMMAESLLVHFEGMRPLLLRLPGLLELDVVHMGDVTRAGSSPDTGFQVDVDVRVAYQLLVAVTEESHKLKKFGFDVTVS